LEQLRDELSPWDEPTHVFLSPNGKRWDERNFARAFNRLRTKAHKTQNVRPLHFHCARHTFASWALEGGRSIKWVQTMLGHASAELTLRTYSHLMPTVDEDMDFLSESRPDQDRTKPDQTVRLTQNAPAVSGRRRLAFSGARDQIRTGDPHVGNVLQVPGYTRKSLLGAAHGGTARNITCLEGKRGASREIGQPRTLAH